MFFFFWYPLNFWILHRLSFGLLHLNIAEETLIFIADFFQDVLQSQLIFQVNSKRCKV